MASGNGRSASVKIGNVKYQIALVLLKERVASSLSLNGI